MQDPAPAGESENLTRVKRLCTGCGACRSECGFLEKYGTPKEIALRHDPARKQGQVMAFECSLCRLCDAVCPEGARPAGMFLEMRQEAATRGSVSFPEHRGLLRYERAGMSRRYTWYGLPRGCRRVLFPGCAFPGTRPGRSRELFERLQEQDPCLGIVLDCCGRISHDLGRETFSRAMLEEMQSYLVSNGVEEVLVVCPNCLDMFKKYAKDLGAKMVYEALPISGAAPETAKDEVVLHDPCAARFNTDCHASVRRLLAHAGVNARDMEHARETTLCCGNGAGVDRLSPELSLNWLERSSGEASGRTIVTYCAGCANTLNTRSRAVHVLDVLSDPGVLANKNPVPGAPLTLLNRLRLKRHFRKNLSASASRERTFKPDQEEKTIRRSRLIVPAALMATIAAVKATGAQGYLDPDVLQGFIQGCGVLAPAIYLLVYALAPSLLLPGLPLTIAAGILFGPLWGVVYAMAGSTAGACLAFLVARYAARDWVNEKLRGPGWQRLDQGVERHGWKVVAFTRLIPLFPFNLLNYAFGLTKIGLVPYAVTSFICMLPACIAFIVFSSSLPDLLQGHLSGRLLVGAGMIVLVTLIPPAYRLYRGKKGRASLV